MASTATEPQRHLSRKRTKKTVLVVEDEELVCDVTCDLLEHSGYRVLRAGNTAEAKQVLSSSEDRVDVLFCDAVLPDGNGIALAESVRQSVPGIKVVLTSGYPAQTLAGVYGREIRAQFLTKPYSAASLLARVRDMLAGSGASCDQEHAYIRRR